MNTIKSLPREVMALCREYKNSSDFKKRQIAGELSVIISVIAENCELKHNRIYVPRHLFGFKRLSDMHYALYAIARIAATRNNDDFTIYTFANVKISDFQIK